MIGLLWKDIYYVKYTWKILLFSCIFSILLLLTKEQTVFVTMMIFALSFRFSFAPFTYDNYSKWSEYQYSLPVSKKTVVCSRYLFGALVFFVCLLLHIINMTLTSQKVEDEYYVLLSTGVIFFIPIAQAVLFPFLYYFGVEKGKLYAIPVFIMIAVIIVSSSSLLSTIISYVNSIILTIVSIVFMIVCYFYSLSLSIRIENEKVQ